MTRGCITPEFQGTPWEMEIVTLRTIEDALVDRGFTPGPSCHILYGQKGYLSCDLLRPAFSGPEEHFLRLDAVYVSPAWRGQGIGRDMLNHLHTVTDSFGLEVRLSVNPFDNGPGKSVLTEWYQRLGYESVSTGVMARGPRDTAHLQSSKLTFTF